MYVDCSNLNCRDLFPGFGDVSSSIYLGMANFKDDELWAVAYRTRPGKSENIAFMKGDRFRSKQYSKRENTVVTFFLKHFPDDLEEKSAKKLDAIRSVRREDQKVSRLVEQIYELQNSRLKEGKQFLDCYTERCLSEYVSVRFFSKNLEINSRLNELGQYKLEAYSTKGDYVFL